MASEKGSRKDKNQNIQVFVRLRPLNQREKDIRSLGVIEVVNGREVVVRQSNQSSHNKKFTFDRAFPPHSKQVEVYQEVVSPLIEEVLAGYNCTVFAYGQTGTGKTHTMVGEAAPSETTWQNDPQAGIIPRALSQLFDELRLTNTEYTVRVSYLELYNEELFDLLSTSEDNSKLRIYEDVTRKGSNIVNGLEEITVYNKNEVYRIMAQGQERKRVASTLMNAQSSRSHTVFTIVVHMKENSPEGEELVKIGKLNLVDLAGSENISKAGSDNPAKRERARECVNINQSLLTLGRVITALVERHPHIPYRESKLTRILQESLGGRTKTSIIATISPGHKDLEETMSTLEYANRAKNIQNKPEINQKMTKKAILKEYAEEIDRLKRDLQAARDKNGVYLASETYTELTFKQEEQRKEIQELILKKRAMEEERERAEKMFSDLNGQLFAERQHREQTYTRLCDTESRLADTHHMLEKTKLHFEEQQHIVEKQQQTERELAAQARRLLHAAELAAGDAGRLCDTVDKRRSVESSNLEVTRTYRERAAQHRDSIARGARQHHADLNAALLDVHNVADKFTNENCDTLTQNQQKLEEMMQMEKDAADKITTLAQELSAALEAGAAEGGRRAAAAVTSQREGVRAALAASARCLAASLQRAADIDVCTDLDKFLQYWHSDTTGRVSALDATAARWSQACRDTADRRATAARLLRDSLRHKRTAFAERVQERLTMITDDRNETERRIARQLSNIETEKSELEARLSSWAERERRELEQRIENYVTTQRQILEQRHAERVREIEDEQRWFENKVDNYVQWLNDMNAENEKEIEQVVSELEESEREMHNHRETVESLHVDCEKGAAGVSAACGDLNENALKIVRLAKDAFVDCVRDARGYVDEETTKAINANEEKMSEVSSELANVLDAQARSCQQTVSAFAQEIHSTTAESGAALAAAAARCGRAAAAARAQHGGQDAALMRLQQAAALFTARVADEVARLDQLEHRCLGDQYRVYSPTGETPGRKEYQYPRSLAATSPHDRILARFRSLRRSQDGRESLDSRDSQDSQLDQDDSVTTVHISDSDSTESEDSVVAIQVDSPPSPPAPLAAPAPPAPQPAPIVKCTSESDIYAHRKVIQGKENMNRSMTFKKPSKLPALSAKKATPLLDKN